MSKDIVLIMGLGAIITLALSQRREIMAHLQQGRCPKCKEPTITRFKRFRHCGKLFAVAKYPIDKAATVAAKKKTSSPAASPRAAVQGLVFTW